MRLLFNLIAAFVLLVVPVVAEDEPTPWQGLAVSQAAEAGLGVCFGTDMAETVTCARDKCLAESGLATENCAADLWCYPHRFAADIFMQHAEGPHWHEFLCGAASREQLDALIAVKCEAEYLIECSAVRVWDDASAELLGLVN